MHDVPPLTRPISVLPSYNTLSFSPSSLHFPSMTNLAIPGMSERDIISHLFMSCFTCWPCRLRVKGLAQPLVTHHPETTRGQNILYDHACPFPPFVLPDIISFSSVCIQPF